jgi:hypothetical protein
MPTCNQGAQHVTPITDPIPLTLKPQVRMPMINPLAPHNLTTATNRTSEGEDR